MRRALLVGSVTLLSMAFSAPATAAALSTYLTYNPVWTSTGVTLTFTYHATEAGYPCQPGSPIGNPVRFRMDDTVISDGTLLGNNCTAVATTSLSTAAACAGHVFSAALHNPGDSTTATETGRATINLPVNSPTMGPYGCEPSVHVQPSISTTRARTPTTSTTAPVSAARVAATVHQSVASTTTHPAPPTATPTATTDSSPSPVLAPAGPTPIATASAASATATDPVSSVSATPRAVVSPQRHTGTLSASTSALLGAAALVAAAGAGGLVQYRRLRRR